MKIRLRVAIREAHRKNARRVAGQSSFVGNDYTCSVSEPPNKHAISRAKLISKSMPTQILFFGAHPDDIEWGVGGLTLLLHQKSVPFSLVDLTRGELGSRGTPAERSRSRTSCSIHGRAISRKSKSPRWRPHRHTRQPCSHRPLYPSTSPQIVVAPLWEDRHPDHAAAGLMVRNAALYCTLKKSNNPNPPHLPETFLYYPLHKTLQPTFVTDITPLFPQARTVAPA